MAAAVVSAPERAFLQEVQQARRGWRPPGPYGTELLPGAQPKPWRQNPCYPMVKNTDTGQPPGQIPPLYHAALEHALNEKAAGVTAQIRGPIAAPGGVRDPSRYIATETIADVAQATSTFVIDGHLVARGPGDIIRRDIADGVATMCPGLAAEENALLLGVLSSLTRRSLFTLPERLLQQEANLGLHSVVPPDANPMHRFTVTKNERTGGLTVSAFKKAYCSSVKDESSDTEYIVRGDAGVTAMLRRPPATPVEQPVQPELTARLVLHLHVDNTVPQARVVVALDADRSTIRVEHLPKVIMRAALASAPQVAP